MALISSTIPNLINGISQQPHEVRQASQAEKQVNGFSSVVNGLVKRAPFEVLSSFTLPTLSNTKVHIYERDEAEKYTVVATNGDLKVFDFEGNVQTVNFPDGKNYLATANPRESFKLRTVADHTFLLNTDRDVRVFKDGSPLTYNTISETHLKLELSELPTPIQTIYNSTTGGYRTEVISPYYSLAVNGENVELKVPQSLRTDTGHTTTPYLIDLEQDKTKEEAITASRYAVILANEIERLTDHKASVLGTTVLVRMVGSSALNLNDNSKTLSLGYTMTYPSGDVVDRYVPTTFAALTYTSSSVTVNYESTNGDTIPTPTAVNKEGIVFVRLGNYGATTKVYIDDVQKASYTTSTTDVTTLQSSHIASQLSSQLSSNLSGYTVSRQGNVIRIKLNNTSGTFKLRAEDSVGETSVIAFQDKITDFQDLPPTCFADYRVLVEGDGGDGKDDFYVQYNDTTGTWEETQKHGLNNKLAAETLPHKLVREANGTFTFQKIDWGSRLVGDLDTSPDPSFVNKKLSDIFFYKNRLGFLAEENVILSESGKYYNFYATTVRASLDTRVLDIAVSDDKIAFLKHAVVFDEALLVFSKYSQFAITSDAAFTAANVVANVATRFESSTRAKPVSAGKNIFFPVFRGGWSGIREYYVSTDYNSKDAADITAHCPTYLEGEVVEMVSSSNEDMVVCTTEGSPDCLYIYSYFWKGNEKIQSSWSKWQTDGTVVGISFVNSNIVALILRGSTYSLERLKVAGDDSAVLDGFSTPILLDRRQYLKAGTTLPYTDNNLKGISRDGMVYTGTNIATQLALQDLYIGIPYGMEYVFSQQQVKQTNTTSPRKDGRLQLRSFAVSFNETGYFETKVTPEGRDTSTHKYTGRTLGTNSNRVGRVQLSSGVYRFPIMTNAQTVTIEIENNTHLPSSFQSVEWEGLYNSRATRI